MALTRTRAVVVAAIGVVLAAMAGRIFDEARPEIVATTALAGVAMILVLGRHWWIQVLTAVGTSVAALLIAALVAGGDLGDARRAFWGGPRRLLSTEWPSPTIPSNVAVVAAGCAIGTVAAIVLVGRRSAHLAPLAPLALLAIAIVALSAPGGALNVWLIPVGILTLVLAALRPDGSLTDRLNVLAGQRKALGLAAATIAVAVGATLWIDMTVRADPRDPPDMAARLVSIDPVEAVVALRQLDPPDELYAIRVDADTTPTRWRLSTLDVYDAQRWVPDVLLARIGRRLGDEGTRTVDYEIELLGDGLELLPLPGPPVVVDSAVRTDRARTTVQLVGEPPAGTVVAVTAEVTPTRSDAAGATPSPRPVDEDASALGDLAAQLGGGDDDLLTRLDELAASLRDDYVRDPDASGAGLQRALIERFLRETRRGTPEQFTTSFVLLARALGVDARLAIGFDVPAEDIDDEVVLRSAHAATWPEVRIDGIGWVAYDPVPDALAQEVEEPDPPPREQSPVAPLPPDNSDTDDEEPDDRPEEVVVDDEEGRWAALEPWLRAGAVTIAVVLLPLVLAAGAIAWIKWRRRRRRLSAREPVDQVRGAWAEATDELVDAGLTIPSSATNREIVAAGVPFSSGADYEIRRLGSMSGVATFGTPASPEALAADALTTLTTFERAMRDARSRRGRLRWRLSVRSLRRELRSPVLGDRH